MTLALKVIYAVGIFAAFSISMRLFENAFWFWLIILFCWMWGRDQIE